MKKFLALARVSSREQEREGFSLDVQVDALTNYAKRQGGQIVKLFRVAETASKKDERQTFRQLVSYAKENAGRLEALLFYKVDRAARNLFDYVELERLEVDHGLRVIYVAQPTENTPAGHLQRRILANMASFYTEQQSVDVKEGMLRRVKSGLFVGHAPYGFRNVRIEGRSLIEVNSEEAKRVQRVFELYAYHNHTIDSLGKALYDEGSYYVPSTPKFPRNKLYHMLRDRAYIGEVHHRNEWTPGTHAPLIDHATWERVQILLGAKIYRAHEMTYAGDLIRCGHCGYPITGEAKSKQTKNGIKEYIYYRCTRYTSEGHPRIRVTEQELDSQVLALFDKMKLKDLELTRWFASVLRVLSIEYSKGNKDRRQELHREITTLITQQDRLVNLRIVDEIDASTYTKKNNELKDRIGKLKTLVDACDRGRDENADLAMKAFELSQSLAERWFTADYNAKRKILDLLCLNCKLEGVSLVPTIRKPFDVLAEGLVLKNGRGGGI